LARFKSVFFMITPSPPFYDRRPVAFFNSLKQIERWERA